jgi:MoaA/NifB/PqqE/SkfB family radical SAM enzyme
MCFYWKNIENARKEDELSLDEISKIARGLRGLHSLIVSGGEPFLREDLEDIIAEFHNRSGTRQVTVPTNLFRDDTAERIRDMAVKLPGVIFRICISLDGTGEDHDIIRGRRGGFEKLMRNYERLRAYKKEAANLKLNVAVVLSSFNAEKITPLLNFAGTLDVDDIKLIYVRGDTKEKEAKDVPPRIYRESIKLAEELSKKRRSMSLYNNLFSAATLVAKELIAEGLDTEKGRVACNAGERFLVISETGTLYPCAMLGRELGRLREHDYSIDSVMGSEKAGEVLRYIKEGQCFCTMDCNTISNVIYSPSLYPRVFKKLLGFYV